MSRLEHIEGARWARQTASEIGVLISRGKAKGLDDVIQVLRRGTEQKPRDYADGVQSVIDLIEEGMK